MIGAFNKYQRLAAYAEELEKDKEIEKAQWVREIILADLKENQSEEP